MEKLHKYYQFTVAVRILIKGTAHDVPVSVIYQMETDDRLNHRSLQAVCQSGITQAQRALGDAGDGNVVFATIINNMYLGIMSEEAMYPPPPAEPTAVLEPGEQAEFTDPAIN